MVAADYDKRDFPLSCDFRNHFVKKLHGFRRRNGTVIHISCQQDDIRLLFIYQRQKLIFQKPFLFFRKIFPVK